MTQGEFFHLLKFFLFFLIGSFSLWCCSKKEMVQISGPSWIGCTNQDKECREMEYPIYSFVLDTFWIDKMEVTVATYEICVSAKKCVAPKMQYINNEQCNFGSPRVGQHPMNCVTWYEADAYCKAQGKQLPTEEQWETAARGTGPQIYPWGNTIASCTHAVMHDEGQGCNTGHTMPVGSMVNGQSPFGVFDMAGNVWEWTDSYRSQSYNGTKRVARGGGFGSFSFDLRVSGRADVMMNYANQYLGFRCSMNILPDDGFIQ